MITAEKLKELVAKFPVPAAKDGKLAEVDKAATDAALAELVAGGKDAYGFVDPGRRDRAARAVEAGVAVILRAQVKQDGRLAVWCAQHDAATLAPAWARKFEPPSLSGAESVGIVRFLMGIERPSPQVIASVEGAVAWFRAAAVHDIRMVTTTDASGQRDKRYVREPGAEPLWARFYELGTNRPIFAGRDSV